MENIILVVHLLIALCLIVVVLIQRSEGGGLGIGSGGGGAMTGRPQISALGKLTWFFGIAFVVTSISLTVVASMNARNSIFDTPAAGSSAPAQVEGESLLPPSEDGGLDQPPAE